MAEKIRMIAIIEVDENVMNNNEHNIEEEFGWLADSGISLKKLVKVPSDFDISDYQQQENKSLKEQKIIRNQGIGFYER